MTLFSPFKGMFSFSLKTLGTTKRLYKTTPCCWTIKAIVKSNVASITKAVAPTPMAIDMFRKDVPYTWVKPYVRDNDRLELQVTIYNKHIYNKNKPTKIK